MIPIADHNPRRLFPGAVLALVVLNVLVFLYTRIFFTDLNSLYSAYGVVPRLAVEYWRSGGYYSLAWLFLSANFLHGGWLHLGGNMLYLWVFGDNVEDRLGHVRFVLFYLLCGFIAVGAQVMQNPDSTAPIIGASGAIAGVLGAYLVLYPRARVSTIIPLIIFFPVVEVPALVLLGFWFLIQLTNSLSAQIGSGVAWWAHVGGFSAGILLVKVFQRRTIV